MALRLCSFVFVKLLPLGAKALSQTHSAQNDWIKVKIVIVILILIIILIVIVMLLVITTWIVIVMATRL